MAADRPRQIITVLSFLLTVAVNSAANALPINQPTAAISDRFQVYVIPAGYVFSIWGVIYLGLAAFTVYQALRGDDPLVRRIGWLPALTGALNVIWLLLFQFEIFVLTVPVMVALLMSLITIHLRLWAGRESLTPLTRWVIRVPFSIYLGWITIATIANVSQTLASLGFDGFGLPPQGIAAAVLLLGLAIAARFVWEFADVAYGLVIVWAYIGIVVKEASSPLVAVVAGGGAILIAVMIIAAIMGRLPGNDASGSRLASSG